ncbi:hypothetical protein M5689_019252 [Euphorbia peplus]|nr:hypothetical protein M5689_019252 [Euphorbia peplus]
MGFVPWIHAAKRGMKSMQEGKGGNTASVQNMNEKFWTSNDSRFDILSPEDGDKGRKDKNSNEAPIVMERGK